MTYLIWYPLGVESPRLDAWTMGSIPTDQIESAALMLRHCNRQAAPAEQAK